jgi:hypothetical protein
MGKKISSWAALVNKRCRHRDARDSELEAGATFFLATSQ